VAEGGRLPAGLVPALPSAAPAATGAAAASALPAAALGVPAGSAGPGGAALRGSSVQEILRGLPPVLPLISRPGRGSDGGDGGARGEGPGYELTPEEERLVQAFQSSLNSAGAVGFASRKNWVTHVC
jgi:hypothetical protein